MQSVKRDAAINKAAVYGTSSYTVDPQHSPLVSRERGVML